MLNAMRQRAGSWFIKALLLVLIASFAVWGIGDVFLGTNRADVVAEVAGVEISSTELDRTFESERRRLEQQLGSGLDRRQAAALGLFDQSLQTLIARAMIDRHRSDLGIGVADSEVARVIREDPMFGGAGGFDRSRFDFFLRSAGLSEAGYVALVRGEIGRGRLLDTLSGVGQPASPLVDLLARHRGERRSGTILAVLPDPATLGEPSDEELDSLLEREAARFRAPEYRSAVLVFLRLDDIIDDIAIDEARIEAEYEARRQFYTTPERRRVAQLLASDRAVAERAAAALRDGAVFADLAESMAGDGLTYGSIGPVVAAELPPELAGPIFALAEGAVSEPVESAFGWHLFRLVEIEPEATRSLDEVREELRRELAHDRAVDQLPSFAAGLDDAVAGGDTLEEAAAAMGVEHRTIAIDASGRGADGRSLGLPREIVQSVFAAPIGETSLLEETADSGFYMFRVDGSEPPRPRRLDEVRDEVAALWREESLVRLAREHAETLLADARGGRTLEAIAEAHGDDAVLRPVGPLLRSDNGSAFDLTPDAVATLFRTAPGNLAPEPVAVRGGVALLRSDAVEAADAATREVVLRELENSVRTDILVQYEGALRRRYPVSVNNAALAAFFPAEEERF